MIALFSPANICADSSLFCLFRTSRPSARNQSGLMTHSFARASGEIVTVWKGHGAKGRSTLSRKLSLHYFAKVTGNINKQKGEKVATRGRHVWPGESRCLVSRKESTEEQRGGEESLQQGAP